MDRRGGIELIHKRHKQYCIDFLLQYYPVREDIEEIYHDGILVLHDKLLDSSFQLTCSIQTYLNTICKNQLFKKINLQGYLAQVFLKFQVIMIHQIPFRVFLQSVLIIIL